MSIKMSCMLKTHKVTRVNWLVGPVLTMVVVGERDFSNGVSFLIGWFIANEILNWISGVLIRRSANTLETKLTKRERYKLIDAGKVPGRVAIVMVVHIIGILLLSWVIVGFILRWFP